MHLGLPLLLTAVALAVSDSTATMVVLTVAAIGVFCTFAVLWTLPTAWHGAIALINSIGNLAGFGGPYLIGWVKEATGSTSTGLLLLAALPLISGLLVFVGGHESKAEFSGAKCGPAPTTSSQTSERQRARSGTHTPRLLVKARWRRLCKTGIGGYGPRPSSGRRRMLANIPLGLGVVILVNTHEMMMTDDY